MPSLEIDTEFARQRGPVERNIYIRSGQMTAQVVEIKQRASIWSSIFVWMLFSFMFGFGIVALYEHALTRSHFNQEN